jgi:hypothetical protein
MGDKPNFHILHWHGNGYAHGDGASHAAAITCTMSQNQKSKIKKRISAMPMEGRQGKIHRP